MALVKKKRVDHEHILQTQMCKILKEKNIFFFAVPNQAVNGRIHLVKYYEAEGLLRGVADLIIPLKGYITLYVEVKHENKKQTPAQKEFERKLKELGHHYYVVNNIEILLDIIKKHTIL